MRRAIYLIFLTFLIVGIVIGIGYITLKRPFLHASGLSSSSVPVPAPAVTMLENFGSEMTSASWIGDAHAKLSADTTLFTQGTQSLRLTTGGAGTVASTHALQQGPYDLTDRYLKIWIRVSSTTNVKDLWLYASSDNLQSNYYLWKLNTQILATPDESEIQAGEWVPLVLTFDSNGKNMVTKGNPNKTAINSFELRATDKRQGPLTVWLGGIASVPEPPQAALTIVFDNGWKSEYTLAMPTLAYYHFPAVIAEIPQTANDPNFMTTSQLAYLQNTLGWDIACHTWDHATELGKPGVATQTMDDEFLRCQNWLNDNGFQKASNILVWPNGSNSPASIAEARKYFIAARGIVGSAFNTIPPTNPMLLYATEFGGETPVATLDADADRCMVNHEWCIFYGHILTTGVPQDQDQYAATDFNAFMAHIAHIGIPVRTISSVLASTTPLHTTTPTHG